MLAGGLATFTLSTAASAGVSGAASRQVPLSARQTLVWAIQGGTSNAIGSEGLASKNEVAAFEKAYPNITIKVVPLSEDADTARATIDRDFLADKLDSRRDRRQYRLDRRDGQRRIHRDHEQLGPERLPPRRGCLDQLQWKTLRRPLVLQRRRASTTGKT